VILKAVFAQEKQVQLPMNFVASTMQYFLSTCLEGLEQTKPSKLVIDFGRLNFVDPVGIVVLSNVIEYFKNLRIKITFSNHEKSTAGIKFLDDSEFFERYLGTKIFQGSQVRTTTMPLRLIAHENAQDYLLNSVMPWIAQSVGMTARSLDSVRVSMEEILHNVADHSGVPIGCTFAQHFPNKQRIEIAISDFGVGIPANVRKVHSDIIDSEALRLACKEGFTTKSNVRNRGAGLPTLIKYVTNSNSGNVIIVSGTGYLTASPNLEKKEKYKITVRHSANSYPGTLVRVILRTDTLEKITEDVEPEEFEW
jgi:anti-anti-sigma regulatory factor/anti-sigma regulatory factor (Ser/Thr protein kinase)